jgi:hypothetical protein
MTTDDIGGRGCLAEPMFGPDTLPDQPTLICRRPVSVGRGWAVRPVDVTLVVMSRFVEDVRRALACGDLTKRFRPDDVRQACPGWADHTYGVFLPKHRRGNPGGYTEYFLQNPDGSYSLIR